MRRSFPFLAVLLLALWLPVTLHCSLEAAGVMPVTCQDEHGGKSDAAGGGSDGCETVENGAYKPSAVSVVLPPPSLVTGVDFLCFQLLQASLRFEPLVVPVPASELASAWIPNWQFVRRAAPPSRAPSLLG